MINSHLMRRCLAIVVILVGFVLVGVGLSRYIGSPHAFITFSLVSLAFMLDSFYRPASVGYFFMVIFLTLGFWIKHILHLLLGYAYLEPTGLFNGSPQAWDEVMWVSTVGLLGVWLGKTLFMRFCMLHASTNPINAETPVPSWYLPLRVCLWCLTIVTILGISFVNFSYGIAQAGILPRLALPWPLNGLMAWILGFGMIVWVLTLVGWDHALNRKWAGVYVVMIEGAVSGISTLSRATYLFHTIPTLLVLTARKTLFVNRLNRGFVLVFVLWIFYFILNNMVVMGLRYADTSPVYASSNRDINLKSPSDYLIILLKKSSLLIVDRWIGLEGVMAVVAYPQKSNNLIERALLERRVKERVDLYTAEIARAGVTQNDMQNFQYATIPGGVAFFYYTGSLFWVLTGMSMLAILLLASERLVLFLTRNPFICSFWGMGAAQTVASFGLGLGQQLTYFAVCFGAMGMIWCVQTFSSQANLRK